MKSNTLKTKILLIGILAMVLVSCEKKENKSSIYNYSGLLFEIKGEDTLSTTPAKLRMKTLNKEVTFSSAEFSDMNHVFESREDKQYEKKTLNYTFKFNVAGSNLYFSKNRHTGDIQNAVSYQFSGTQF